MLSRRSLILIAFSLYPWIATANPGGILVSLDPAQPLFLFELHLEKNLLGDLPKKAFKKRRVLKNISTIEINSQSVSQNLLAIMAGVTRGTTAPQIGDIESQIDTPDEKGLIKLLTEIGEERRHIETGLEWHDIVERFDGRLSQARFNAYLFSTGYLEIIPPREDYTYDSHVRYFVRIDALLERATGINAELAKLRLIQGLSNLIYFELVSANPLPNDTHSLLGYPSPNTESQLDQLMASFVASFYTPVTPVQTLGPIVGLLLVDFHHFYLLGKSAEYSDVDLARLNLRKRICILKTIHDVYPEIPALGVTAQNEIDGWLQQENLNCRDRKTFFRGLSPVSSGI